MANYGALLLLFLLTGGALFLVIYLPLTASADIPMPVPLAFSAGLESHHYQQRVCPGATWTLASNERVLSDEYCSQSESIPDPRGLSNLVWAWGQFIDHDIVRSKTNASAPIHQLGNLNLTRVEMTNGEPRTCITPLIDGTTIYGDYLNVLPLRDPGACRLRTSNGNLPPFLDDKNFLCGDERCTEHALLTALHTLFLREHNRLCDELDRMRPTWTGEEKFWKARQVVVAKIQRITYEEWLPALLGDQIGLLESVPARGTGIRIVAEFSGAAYRFGHSMVSNTLGQWSLLELFFNRPLIEAQGIEPFLAAALSEPAQKVDSKVVDGLRNVLFGVEDLVTRNFFRARDIGLGTYQQIAACYGTYVYAQNQPDPLLGLLQEPLAHGSSLPVTIATIVAEQFGRLRRHDPHFYSRVELGAYFGYQVGSATIGDVIRKNTHLKNIKTRGFYV